MLLTMTPEQLSRIRQIYDRALPLSGSDREACLDRECRADEETRKEVEGLLKGHDRAPAWLEQPALGAAKAVLPLEAPKLEGRRVGSYTLIREIGRGGSGVVYLAERSDNAFRRQAAVKLVLPPADSAAVISRFQQEREILASLDHPNIAKLLDAGVTEEGWPFFIMEFVDGQPIDRWCDQRKLTVSQRLELFGGVVDAVQFAHRHLVVHRDLKPGNIFVTNDGIVKLLDFGIAKVLAPSQPGEAPETLTLAGMMTPEYASPEQLNGTAITTLSDVYSLGVVLYELLTGHRPYRLLSAAVHEMVRVISEVEPVRPSEVVTTTEQAPGRDRGPITPETISEVREGDPNRLRKRLAGDLDAILLTALRKEPERRYVSVESLADDLQRHLEQLPVRAREAGPWERFRRLSRRNPGGLLAGGLVLTLFFAGLAAVALQMRHDVLAAQLNRGSFPFIAPFWLFTAGTAVAALGAAHYFARPNRSQRLGVAAGALIWAGGLAARLSAERTMGLWRSRIDGNADPFMILAPWTWGISWVFCAAQLLVGLIVGRRFGLAGQVLWIALLSLYIAAHERHLFGESMPALHYQAGLLPILASSAMVFAPGLISVLVMRRIGGPDDRGADPGRHSVA
jgi:serine/threonine protein kinase